MTTFRSILIALALLSTGSIFAQITSGLIFKYDFDDCSNSSSVIRDVNGNMMADGLVIGSPACRPCGINNSGFYFDGSTQILAGEFINAFPSSNAFTLGFLLQPEDGIGSYEVFSKSDNCGNDSAMLCVYTPSSRELTLFMQESSSKRVELSAIIPEEFCWFHVGITRRSNRVDLYINGRPVDNGSTSGSIFIANHDLYFGGGQCTQNYQPYRGLIDEIELYDDVFTQAEMMNLAVLVNEIPASFIQLDSGEVAQIEVKASCASMVQWSPNIGISDPNSFNPILNPENTTTYLVEITDQNTGCITTDSILIQRNVNIACKDIFLPTAFRPSSDIDLNRTLGIAGNNDDRQLLRFSIFDRKGNLVWQTTNKEASWDGTFNGELLPPETYVCKIRYRCGDEVLNHTSTVYLLR